MLVEKDLLTIRDIGPKREPKKDISCIILEFYQFQCVDQIIQCMQKKKYPIVTKYLFDIVVLVFLKNLLWNILKYFFIFLIQAIQNHKKYYKIYF
jgi:hypothetical protein